MSKKTFMLHNKCDVSIKFIFFFTTSLLIRLFLNLIKYMRSETLKELKFPEI